MTWLLFDCLKWDIQIRTLLTSQRDIRPGKLISQAAKQTRLGTLVRVAAPYTPVHLCGRLVGERNAGMVSVRGASAQVGGNLWFTWILATLAGFSAGFLLEALIAGLWSERQETNLIVLAHVVALLLGGALLAILQYIVLRRAVDGPALSGSSLAPTGGVILGATLAGIVFGSIAPFDPAMTFLVTLAGGALGGLVARWLVLRRPAGVAGWGIAVTSLSLGLGFFLGYGLGGGGVDFLVAATMVGLVGGLVQWRMLRPCVRRAGWWAVASGLGFTVSAFIVVGLPGLFNFYDALYAAQGEALGDVIILAMWGVFGGLIAGAITGALLVRLLRPAAEATAKTALAAGVR
jgi:hypothetical protein